MAFGLLVVLSGSEGLEYTVFGRWFDGSEYVCLRKTFYYLVLKVENITFKKLYVKNVRKKT